MYSIRIASNINNKIVYSLSLGGDPVSLRNQLLRPSNELIGYHLYNHYLITTK